MNPWWRERIMATLAAAVGVWLGFLVADGSYALPLLFGGLAALATVVFTARLSLDTLILGGLLFGYLVGNRGFAQLMPIPNLPLLPAEFALLVGGSWLVVRCAFAHELPLRRDSLNALVFLWILIGTCRVVLDVRQFGLLAIRDFAMIYYAAFFFLTQHIAADARARRFLFWILLAASCVQPAAALLTNAFPEFFLGTLTFRGVPLIFFKGDLALTFMAVSALLLACGIPERHRIWAWPIATLELLYVIGGGNRASMVGALVALLWLLFSTVRRFVLLQFGALVIAGLALFAAAHLGQNAWAEEKARAITERVVSLGDFLGTGTYVTEESGGKGDNNRFRTVWWDAVWHETMHNNPVFGLGFGYDLARSFLQEFNPELAEDFTARSPHSILLSAVGRMGVLGLAAFCAIATLLCFTTWRVVRTAVPARILGLWGALWVILISACFGVVLEGPMGAVVFWSMLGLAHASRDESTQPDEVAELAPTASAPLAPQVVTHNST